MVNNEIGEISISKPKRSGLLLVGQIFRIVVISLLIIIPIRYYATEPFFVKGASMEHTFEDGDYLFIDEISYRFITPKRGDVIVFQYPLDLSQSFIKRIIGLPNETVEIKNNTVKIFNDDYPDGVILTENYLDSSQETFGDIQIKLKKNEYFVMGDNRTHSSDSRQWGVLGRNLIDGKVSIRLWPLDHIEIVHSVEY